jgi:hypothetical protein
MAENTKLYDAIQGLHETDSKIWGKTQEVSGAVGIKSFPTTVTSVVATDGKISDDLLPGVTFNNKGKDTNFIMGSNIKFIGNCNVVKDETTGQLIIRIGDNLNSSTFNNTDGITTGTAKYSDNTNSYPVSRVTKAAGDQSIWKKGTNDVVTITTNEKIHFDDATKTIFTVKVTSAGTITTYNCGPVTGNGNFGTAPCVLTVSDWADETKSSEGATGYMANISIALTLSSIVTKEGSVSFEVSCAGTSGALAYKPDAVAYFIVDGATKPTVSNFTAKLTTHATQTYGGITSVKSGTVTYVATVANLNAPATDAEGGASIEITNDGFAAGVSKVAQTTYDGTITKTGTLTTTTKTYAAGDFDATFTAWNINSSASATATLTDKDGNAFTKLYVDAATPAASILSTNRVTLASTTKADKVAYTDSAAPADGDLMVYQAALQYPSAFIDNTVFGNSGYTAPSTTGDKAALFWFSASGTENSCTLTINGSGLNGANVKSVTFGNSVANLKPLSGYTDNGSSTAAGKLVYKFAYKTDADKPNTDTGVFLKVVFSGTGPKITSITKGL